MTLGRDFRLPKDVRPRRYWLRFDLDLDSWTFTGRERVSVELAAPRRELYLHAAEIGVSSAIASRDGRRLIPGREFDEVARVLVLRFEEALSPGPLELELEFSGPIRGDLKAIYRSTRGDERYAVTQFQAADARRAFPCFDEPAFKARFALELVCPSGLAAIANTRVVTFDDLGGGRTRWRFAETPPLSSYLLAFAVGPFEATEVVTTRTGVPVRIWLPHGMAAEGVYARDLHREAIEWLESYTGIPYPYDKVEGLGIPDFAAGAMENPGAVTYRLQVLAADPRKASTAVLKQCAEYIAHELTHMWWGDLVTFAWWDDIWLNEAFATFVGYKANDALRRQWRFWRDFLYRGRAGFDLDALASTHPISMPARTAEEASQRFDRISYEKGASVLRMIEGYLGEETFRRGVRTYLERFRESNASAADFWSALDDVSAQDMTKVASAWINEPGHPLVELRLVGGDRVAQRQRRFFADPATRDTGQRWPIPLVLRTGARREVRALLEAAEGEIEIPPDTWVFPNARSAGFYRYALDGALRGRLLAHVLELEPEERLGLVDNDWSLLSAGVADAAEYVALLRALEDEDDRAVLLTLYEQLRWLEVNAVGEEERPAFARLVESLFAPHLERLGWEPRSAESDDEQQLRPIVIRALAHVARVPAVRAEGARRVRAHLDGDRADRNVTQALAIAAAVDGDAALQTRYVQHVKDVALSDVQEETRFRLALAFFEDTGAVRRSVTACFDGTIRDQDLYLVFEEGLLNRAARESFWHAIRDHWDERIAPLETNLRNYIIGRLARVTAADLVPAIREFLVRKRREDSAEVTAQGLERLRLEPAAAARIGRELASALAPERSLPR